MDAHSGRSFEHRRGWIENRLLALGQVFGVEIAAYAVMSNHLHLVLRLNQTAAQAWAPIEVITRWHQLFNGTALSKRALKGDALSTFEQKILDVMVTTWRKRLCDVSWFTKCFPHFALRAARQALKNVPNIFCCAV